MNDLANFLRAELAHRPSLVSAEWDTRPAAVLVPLYQVEGVWHVLFTQRTELVETHKGQVSFPGGRVDPEDEDRVATALREAEEEIGLRREDVTVLGLLDELLTVTQYRVTPVVGTFPWPYTFVLSEAELSEVFGVPLAWLADPRNLEIQYREPLTTGRKVPVYYLHYDHYTIWGATARMVLNLLDVLRPLLDDGRSAPE
jgi:8-oxo-dGTP pyrophosphatase MutT (NUDIX family)